MRKITTLVVVHIVNFAVVRRAARLQLDHFDHR